MNTAERTLLIAVCSIIAIAVVILTLNTFLSSLSQEKQSPTVASVHNPVDLLFVPNTIFAGSVPNLQKHAIITVNTHGSQITGVQIELLFDPKIITSFTITPSTPNFFSQNPQILLNTVDLPNGRASFAEAISGNALPQAGSGNIADITFTINPYASGSGKISFLPKTLVSAPNSDVSILGKTQDLSIVK